MHADLLRYAISIEWSDEDRAYIVTAPELPGCRAHGFTYEEAVAQGKEAIVSWINAREESGRPVPAPRGIATPVSIAFPPSFRQWIAATEHPDRIQVRYNRQLDALTIALGEVGPAYPIDGGDGLVVRIDRDTNEFIGLEIVHCREVFLPKHPEFWLTYLLAASRVFQLVVRFGLWLVRHEPGADQTVAADTAMRAAVTAFRAASTTA